MSGRAQDLQALRNAGLMDAARIQANALIWWADEGQAHAYAEWRAKRRIALEVHVEVKNP